MLIDQQLCNAWGLNEGCLIIVGKPSGFSSCTVYWLPSMYLYAVKIIKSLNYFIKKAFEKLASQNEKQAHPFPMVEHFIWAQIQY